VVIVADATLRYNGPLAKLTEANGESLEQAFLRLTASSRPTPASDAATASTRA